MNSLADWYKDESNATELAALLHNPVLQRALAVVTAANSPVFRVGVGLNDLATLHAFQAGVHHVPRTLHMLTQPPVAHDPEAMKEWEGEHVVPTDSETPTL